MKRLALVLAVAMSSSAFAKASFQGSTTLGGVVSDSIVEAKMTSKLEYTGGGSGKGAEALIAGTQGIAPMSREMKQAEEIDVAKAKGIYPFAHKVALDGLSMFVNAGNPVASLTYETINKIFACEFTTWEQVPNNGGMTGPIVVYRRDDVSGTTEAFKHFTNVKFGACIPAENTVAESADIGEKTSSIVGAIGYGGLSALNKDGLNRIVPIGKVAGDTPVYPTEATVRDFSYPMTRYLYIYEARNADGSTRASADELELLAFIQDESQVLPIMQKWDFFFYNEE